MCRISNDLVTEDGAKSYGKKGSRERKEGQGPYLGFDGSSPLIFGGHDNSITLIQGRKEW